MLNPMKISEFNQKYTSITIKEAAEAAVAIKINTRKGKTQK